MLRLLVRLIFSFFALVGFLACFLLVLPEMRKVPIVDFYFERLRSAVKTFKLDYSFPLAASLRGADLVEGQEGSSTSQNRKKIPEEKRGGSLDSAVDPSLHAFANVFSNIAKQARPALVFIQTQREVSLQQPALPFGNEFFSPFQIPRGGGGKRGIQQGAGSGFIADLNEGYVITNHHVIEKSDEIIVTTMDDRQFAAELIGSEPTVDIAVLKLKNFSKENLHFVTFSDSDAVEVGDWVVALGAPFSLPQTLTMGVVSALGRGNVVGGGALEDFIQTDAAINPGNSGGPLLDLESNVIGVNTAISSPTGSSAGVGFAVPANMVRLAAEMIINRGKVVRGFLGIEGRDFSELSEEVLQRLGAGNSVTGAVVVGIVPGSPAQQAGLQPYDVLLTLNGSAIKSYSQLRTRLAFTAPGSSVTLNVLRQGKAIQIKVVMGDFSQALVRQNGVEQNQDSSEPDSMKNGVIENSELGIVFETLNLNGSRKKSIRSNKGVLILDVAPLSLGSEAGLLPHDVVLELNRVETSSAKALNERLEFALQEELDLLFLIEREGREQLVLVRMR